MPGRQPNYTDFAPSAYLSITPAPAPQPPTNVLILLHGLGDTNRSFTKLGLQLNLPETTCIALQAPTPLPFDLGGFHWGDDMIFDQNTGEMDIDTGFKKSTRLLLDTVIRDGLINKCGYLPREIVIYGFGQGGMVALQAAAEFEAGEFGGVISVGGPLSTSTPLKALQKKTKTPVLVCKASRSSAVKESSISKMKDAFEFIEIQEWKRNGDAMPSNRDEMLPIMKFFARRLRSTRGVPAGSIEIS